MPVCRLRSSLSDPGLRNILMDLRRRILNGRLPAGTRLPAVRELAASYGVAGTTIHRCLQELGTAGFLSTHGRNGTRVVDFPPHRHCYGLVLPELPGPDGAYHTRHWQAKALAARALSTGKARRIEIFHGLNGHPDQPEHQGLLAALAQQRLAGIILPDADLVSDWLVPARLALPVVGVDVVPGKPAIGQLLLDLNLFLARALAAVAERGRRRPAVLLHHHALSYLPELSRAAQRCGLALPPQRIQCLPTQTPEWAAHVIAGLFTVDASQAPDALILGDEVCIPAVEAALTAQGVNEILQIHIANLPLPTLARRPALRIGWDNSDYLLVALARIDAWHQRREAVGQNVVPLADSLERGV